MNTYKIAWDAPHYLAPHKAEYKGESEWDVRRQWKAEHDYPGYHITWVVLIDAVVTSRREALQVLIGPLQRHNHKAQDWRPIEAALVAVGFTQREIGEAADKYWEG